MSEKRKLVDQSPDGSSSTKHTKVSWPYWSDGKVCYVKEDSNKPPAIRCVDIYQREEQDTCDRSFEEIKDQIGNTETLKLSHKKFFYYTGFKNGLIYLLNQICNLTQIKRSSDKQYLAILIHGIPNVGKSSLAQNLAYHLSSMDGTATLVKMNNNMNSGRDAVTEALWNYIDKPGWVILDQVNVHNLERESLKDWLEEFNRKTPLIIFTSGHYAPPAQSWGDDTFLLKVIDLRVDEAGVELVKKAKGSNINTQDLLEVTNVFGHVYKMIMSPVNTKDEMLEEVYKGGEFSQFVSLNPNVLWVLWPQYCTASSIPKETKPEMYRISPSKVEILGDALRFEQDPENRQTRLFVNWLHIDGDGRCNRNKSDGFYVHEEYFYYFPLVEKLHDRLRQALEIAPEEKLRQLVRDYHAENSRYSCGSRSRMGYAFEAIIRMKLHLHFVDNKCGLTMDGRRGVKFGEVDDVLEPSSPDELCQMVEEKRAANRKKEAFWCDLNARNDQFPGYDFAAVEMQDGKYSLFELFQTTVSKGKLQKKAESMEKVLEQILRKLPNDAFQLNTEVVPYLLCPYESNRSCEEKVTFGKHFYAQVINMVSF